MKKQNLFLGIVLISLGILLFAYSLFGFRLGSLMTHWPILIILMGAFFELSYFSQRKRPELLVPGGIFLVVGILFEFETLTGWNYVEYTWPVYLLAVAFGLLQLYIFSNQPRPIMILVCLLSLVAALAYLIMIFTALASVINFGIVIPLFLVALGLFVMFRK